MCAGHHFEAGGVADEFVQRVDDLRELGPQVPLLHPAVEHELVESGGAVHGRGQSIVLLHRIYHLQGQGQVKASLFTYTISYTMCFTHNNEY